MKNNETPKTLQEAINSGLIEACLLNASKREKFDSLTGDELKAYAQELKNEQLRIIEMHILEHLRQQLSWGCMKAEEVDELGVCQSLRVMRDLARRLGIETDIHTQINERKAA